MKAFIMDEDRTLKVVERPEPVKESDNNIVKVKAASICGTDMRTFLHGNIKIDPPRILGHEFAGDIVYASEYAKSKGFQEGDRITVAPAIGCGECWPCSTGHTNMCDHLETIGFQYDGVFASCVAIPAKAIRMGNVIKLPDNVSYDAATLIEPAACAYNGQTYLHIQKGDNVVIYGSGLIGCIHAELALLQGAAKVMICEPVEKRGRIAEEKVPGVIWIDNGKKNAVEEVKRLTNGVGANVVITATSYPPVQIEAQEIAAKMARICLFGGLPGEGKGYVDSNMVHYKELQICGVHATTADYMREILKLIEEGKLDSEKYIEKIVSLDDIMNGFESIRDENVMKVVVHP
jgi:L-iditol 2-dehydrogenase